MTPAARARALVARTLAAHPGRVALACSFGGPAGMVLLDLVARLDRSVPVYYLDTGLLFPETYELVERASRRYGIVPQAVRPRLSLGAQAALHGQALWERDPDRCCALRKVEPNRAFVAGYAAWLTGIRRAQTVQRADVVPVADEDGVRKISPLHDWSDAEVWAYVNAHDVPVNALHADGYPSIGCVPCTQRPLDPADPRSGRWAGFGKTECGLHLPPAAAAPAGEAVSASAAGAAS
ncbi:MAG TPA: phosphoadenylyl-sulfate reductase [Candidatus Sulfotelmatobacter sp.]|nr:phosphoadenylyl-sulfate reductase [Candidatus Sulfotelmatobacter sp.]